MNILEKVEEGFRKKGFLEDVEITIVEDKNFIQVDIISLNISVEKARKIASDAKKNARFRLTTCRSKSLDWLILRKYCEVVKEIENKGTYTLEEPAIEGDTTFTKIMYDNMLIYRSSNSLKRYSSFCECLLDFNDYVLNRNKTTNSVSEKIKEVKIIGGLPIESNIIDFPSKVESKPITFEEIFKRLQVEAKRAVRDDSVTDVEHSIIIDFTMIAVALLNEEKALEIFDRYVKKFLEDAKELPTFAVTSTAKVFFKKIGGLE